MRVPAFVVGGVRLPHLLRWSSQLDALRLVGEFRAPLRMFIGGSAVSLSSISSPPATLTHEPSAGDEILALGWAINANQYQIVHAAARFDEELEWMRRGHRSASAWISTQLQVQTSTAAEWVRVGHALQLPAVGGCGVRRTGDLVCEGPDLDPAGQTPTTKPSSSNWPTSEPPAGSRLPSPRSWPTVARPRLSETPACTTSGRSRRGPTATA